MNRLYGGAALILAVTTAFFAGVNSGADSLRDKQATAASKAELGVQPGELKQQVIRQEVVKIETKTEYIMHEQCARAIEAALEAQQSVEHLLSNTGQLKKITQTLASAIVNEKVTELNDMRRDMRKYDSDILGSVLDLGDIRLTLSNANDKCSEVVGEQALAAP